MKPLTKTYLKFFLFAYLIFRLPSLLSPMISEFLIDKAISSLTKSGIKIDIEKKSILGLGSIELEKISVSSERNLFPTFLIDGLKTNLVSIFPPKLEIYSKSYEGNLDCTFASESFIQAIFNNFAKAECVGKNFNLLSIPVVSTKNLQGRLSFELHADVSSDLSKNTSQLAFDISKGYFEVEKFLATSLVKLPPFSQVDSTGTINFKINSITLENIQFRSNYGFITSNGELKPNQNFQFLDQLDLNGTFNLSSEGFETIAPWSILINNGKEIKSKKGSFSASGKPPQVKISLSETQ